MFSGSARTIVSAAQQRDNILFEDRLENDLKPGWSWVREESAGHRIGGRGLDLRVLSGTLWAETNTAKNLLLRRLPERTGGVSVEVTLTSSPQIDGEQAGLILYRNDRNYIKLVKEFKGTPHVILVREENDKPVVIATVECPAESVVLGLVLTGGRVRARFSTNDGNTWREAGDCMPLPKTALAGVFTHVWPGKSKRWVRFSTFRIRPERGCPMHGSVIALATH